MVGVSGVEVTLGGGLGTNVGDSGVDVTLWVLHALESR